MSAARISAALRKLVWERARGFCEYCHIHDDEVLLSHEIDHVVAEQHGGPSFEENLSLACFQCNKLKGPNLAGIDALTGAVEALFHPRLDDWHDHFMFQGPHIEARSARGRATIHILRLNAPERLRVRMALQESGRVFV